MRSAGHNVTIVLVQVTIVVMSSKNENNDILFYFLKGGNNPCEPTSGDRPRPSDRIVFANKKVWSPLREAIEISHGQRR